jgi:glycosyltransferase involved in cell wall biosynthesis
MDHSTPRAPILSVVMCTRDRAEPLRSALESLCRQTLPQDLFEIVVVDDGSTDSTPAVARAFEARLPLRYSHQRSAGIGSARNHGVFLARGAVLLFLDEDVAGPALLEAHLEAHRRFPEPFFGVLGRTRLAPSLATDPLMQFLAGDEGFLLPYPTVEPGAVLDFGYFWAGRSSCKRRFLLEGGVFNPLFRSTCEDLELAARLSRRGFRIVYAPRAESALVQRFTVDDLCRRMRREGEASVLLRQLHGEQLAQRRAGTAGGVEGASASAVRSARELDRLVRARLEVGLPVEEHVRALLHRSYLAAFTASRLEGMGGQRSA